jgi:hypothetical protein
LALPHKGPRAVLTINFNENPKGFAVNQFYILKVLQVRKDTIGYDVDFGFVRLEVQE